MCFRNESPDYLIVRFRYALSDTEGRTLKDGEAVLEFYPKEKRLHCVPRAGAERLRYQILSIEKGEAAYVNPCEDVVGQRDGEYLRLYYTNNFDRPVAAVDFFFLEHDPADPTVIWHIYPLHFTKAEGKIDCGDYAEIRLKLPAEARLSLFRKDFKVFR